MLHLFQDYSSSKITGVDQWYSTWGTRRHLRAYVKLKKKIFHDKRIK
jgi:hypothetical protein